MKYQDQLLIDELCDQFEAEISTGRRPCIEEFLKKAGDQLQRPLLQNLIPLEIIYLLKLDQSVEATSYNKFGQEAGQLAEQVLHEHLYACETVSMKTETVAGTVDEVRVGGRVRYRLIHRLGSGGFGVVWLAEQLEPFRRRVALKLMNRTPDNLNDDGQYRMMLARFDSERQALAQMEHQNIAKILDGGTTDENCPFLTMELACSSADKPVNIIQYCDQNRLSLRERLKLFLDICSAVIHAHQRAIIHRDLKPSNILIAFQDNEPVVKVVDFGLAKWLSGSLTDLSLQTGANDVVGTLLYMSPEQAGRKPPGRDSASVERHDVDTRSDLYSLGVILYELLVGSTPIQREIMLQIGLHEQLSIVLTHEPERLSRRLSAYEDSTRSEVTLCRQIDSSRFQSELSGELDWIVMKALEKEKGDRYESVAAFSKDIENYLTGSPVNARPASLAYTTKKFIHRNRALVGIVATIFVLLIGGIAGTSYGLLQANSSASLEREARQDAIEKKQLAEKKSEEAHRETERAKRQEQIASLARTEAEKSAKRSADVLKIVTDSFLSADPNAGSHANMPASQVLLNALQSLKNSELDEQGRVELLTTLARAFLGLGDYEAAISTAQEATKILRQNPQENQANLAKLLNILAMTHQRAGNLDQAILLLEEVVGKFEGEHDEFQSDALVAKSNLATVYQAAGRGSEALPLMEQTVMEMQKYLGEINSQTITTMNNLSEMYNKLGRKKDAIALLEKVLRLRKENLGKNHPFTLIAMINLANLYNTAGRNKDALDLLQAALPVMQDKLGEDHPDTLGCENVLATVLAAAGQRKQASALAEKVWEARKLKLGEDHLQTLISLNNLANHLLHLGQVDLAIEKFEQALDGFDRTLGREHPNSVSCAINLAQAYLKTEQEEKAIPLLERQLAWARMVASKDHVKTFSAVSQLAHALDAAGRTKEAIPLFIEILNIRRSQLGPDNEATIGSMINLGYLYNQLDQFDKAILILTKPVELSRGNLEHTWARKALREAYRKSGKHDMFMVSVEADLQSARKEHQPKSIELAQELVNLGDDLLESKDYEQAEALLHEGYEIRHKKEPTAWTTFNAQSLWGESLLEQKKYDKARPLLLAAYNGLKSSQTKTTTDIHVRLVEAVNRLIRLTERTGDDERLKRWKAELKTLQNESKREPLKQKAI